jgi:hypothetical protein
MKNCKAYRDGVADACLGLGYKNKYKYENNISMASYHTGFLDGMASMGFI